MLAIHQNLFYGGNKSTILKCRLLNYLTSMLRLNKQTHYNPEMMLIMILSAILIYLLDILFRIYIFVKDRYYIFTIQTTLFIPTLDTTTKFIIMTI